MPLRTVIEPQPSHAGASPISAAFEASRAFAATVFAVRSTAVTASITRVPPMVVSEMAATLCEVTTRVVGDVIGMGLAGYVVWEARNLKMPKWKLLRMAANVAVDTAVGAVPVVGDVFDFMFRSNSKNLRIVKNHLDKHHPETRLVDQ